MKRTAFRLQPVLELRRTEERSAARAAAAAAAAADEAERRATERETALTAAVVPGSASARVFLATRALLAAAAADASDARAVATASAEQAEAVRAEWTAAAQRTKGLERLRERHLTALQHAEDRAEELAADDLVTSRTGCGPGSTHGRGEEASWTA